MFQKIITYINLHIFYIITNILFPNSYTYNSKFFNYLHLYQESYYINPYNPMPYLIYIHQFKELP